MPEGREILRATGVVAASTFLSRVLGLLRDVVISGVFGAGTATDAFFVAFAIPNFFRRLLGEGSLTVSFVPVYTHYLTKEPEEAKRVIHVVATAVLLLLLSLTALGVLLAPWLVKIQVFGWRGKEALPLAVTLTRLCFPYLFFISLVALSMGVLNAHGHFAAPALAPCLLNLSLIASALLLAPHLTPPIASLAWGVLLGGVLQLLLQAPFLRAKGVTFRVDLDLRHPALKEIGKLMVPMVAGIAVFQINQVVNRFLASFLPHGSISYLYYADRLFELPLGLFAVAMGVAVLPSFSRHVALGRWEDLGKDVNLSLRAILFLSIPAMVGIIVLRVPLIHLFFQHGAFGPRDTLLTAQALLCYSLSIWAYGGIQVMSRAFYALRDAKTPVKVAAGAAVLNLGFGLLLMHPLKHAGLALANSLSAIFNSLLLFYLLRGRIEGIGRGLRKALLKVGLSSLAMLPWLLLWRDRQDWISPGGLLIKGMSMGIMVGGGAAIFFGASFLLRSEELRTLLAGARPRPPATPQG